MIRKWTTTPEFSTSGKLRAADLTSSRATTEFMEIKIGGYRATPETQLGGRSATEGTASPETIRRPNRFRTGVVLRLTETLTSRHV